MNWSAGKIGTINQRSAHANGLSTPPIGCVLHLLGLPGGGNKIYDRSPYGNIGTITGATWARTLGGLWCLDFDGSDDYVEDGNINLDYITIEAWIKRSETGVWHFIVSKGSSWFQGTRTWDLRVNGEDALEFVYSLDGSAYYTTAIGTVGTDWAYVVATYDGQKARVYLNTSEAVGATHEGTLFQYARDVRIGNSPSPSGFPFKGLIALPRIYNRALSALEIQNHFNREKHLFGVV